MSFNYPLLLDVSQRPIVIIGGGAVAARKIRGLLDAGASNITVVAPSFDPDIPDSIHRVTARYVPQHLDGASLVFAATDDPAINARVVADAHSRGLLVNRADSDDDSPGDFSTPAMLRDNDLLITVSAGGSPALAASLRDHLRSTLSPRWSKMVAAMKQLRPRILASGAPIEVRRAAFRDLASDHAIDLLDHQGEQALWNWLAQRHKGI